MTVQLLDGPVVVLDGGDVWRLLHGRLDRQHLDQLRQLAARWEAEQRWQAALEPAASTARGLGITPAAMRHLLRRGRWPGEQVDGRWYAVPPGSELAPPCRP